MVKAECWHGLVRILFVGESLDVRREGDQVDFTLAQLTKGLENVALNDPTHLVVAYEPVWAIGTGEVATPQDAQEVCRAIRGRLEDLYSGAVAGGVRVLYGGSVKAANIASIMAQPDVDGA